MNLMPYFLGARIGDLVKDDLVLELEQQACEWEQYSRELEQQLESLSKQYHELAKNAGELAKYIKSVEQERDELLRENARLRDILANLSGN